MDFLRQDSGDFRMFAGMLNVTSDGIPAVRRVAAAVCLGFFLTGIMSCGFFTKTEKPEAREETPEARDKNLPVNWLHISVEYTDGSFLPSGSVLTLTLEAVSGTDVFRSFIGETVLEIEGAPPYIASLGYNPKLIQDSRRYALSAEIRHYGRLLYTTRTVVDPFAQGAGEPVTLRVKRVPRSRDPGGL